MSTSFDLKKIKWVSGLEHVSKSFLAVFFKSWSASQGKKKVVPSSQNFLREALHA
jgi:hypothetical protein